MTATKEHLTSMFEYVRWGDNLIMRAARSVPDEGYYREQGISVGSIHKLLVHAMAAQWIWLSRWRGESPTRLETHDDYPTRDALEQRWPLVHSAVLDFLSMQTPKSLGRMLEYRNNKGEVCALPLGDQVLYVIDHSTYHRGQQNTMIKRAGGTPAAVAYVMYCFQRARSA
jgi:uncharacterized damage-inducible protein DinB